MAIIYALVDPEDNVTKIQTNVDPDAATKPGWRWLPIEEDPAPAHDPKTQQLERFQILESDRLYCGYTVRDKTQQEIDQEKDQAVESISPIVLAILLDQENRTRALEQQPTVTIDEFKVILRAFV